MAITSFDSTGSWGHTVGDGLSRRDSRSAGDRLVGRGRRVGEGAAAPEGKAARRGGGPADARLYVFADVGALPEGSAVGYGRAGSTELGRQGAIRVAGGAVVSGRQSDGVRGTRAVGHGRVRAVPADA